MDQKVLTGESVSEDRSVFGRKRLPRRDPHLWADKLEDWFARLTQHVALLYFLAGIGVVHFAWDVLGWLDAVATGQAPR